MQQIYKVQASNVNVVETEPAKVMERPQKSTERPAQQEARQDVTMTTDLIHLLLTRRLLLTSDGDFKPLRFRIIIGPRIRTM